MQSLTPIADITARHRCGARALGDSDASEVDFLGNSFRKRTYFPSGQWKGRHSELSASGLVICCALRRGGGGRYLAKLWGTEVVLNAD